MKICKVGAISKIVTLLLCVLLLVPVTGFSFYLAILDPRTAPNNRPWLLAGTFLFGGVLLFAIYRAFWQGLVWVEYDNEKVFFHPNRREQYFYRWEDIPGEHVQVGPDGNGGYVFCILENGKTRKLLFNHLSSGWRDFRQTLEATGVLRRIGVMSRGDFKHVAEQMLRNFEVSRTAPPNAVKPKPEGDFVLCPRCGGKGWRVKTLLPFQMETGAACEVCKGVGYLPRQQADGQPPD